MFPGAHQSGSCPASSECNCQLAGAAEERSRRAMKPGHWQQVEEIFQEALQRDPGERDAFVREACRGDAELHREVSSLLANHRETANSKPWAAAAAARLIDGRTSLQAGQRLSPYEIVAPIGAGGMGEVYRARDTKLKRDVALKVLPDAFAQDPG